MLRFAEVLHVAMRGCARTVALAGLVAGGVLLMPALAGAATQDAKSAPAAAPNAEVPRKVSPYAVASRQHLEASIADGAHPLKHPVGQSLQAKPVRAKSKRH